MPICVHAGWPMLTLGRAPLCASSFPLASQRVSQLAHDMEVPLRGTSPFSTGLTTFRAIWPQGTQSVAPKSKLHNAACLSIVAPCAAVLALMTSFDILTNLVNVGYLFGAMMVASSVLIRRYMPTGPEAMQSRRAGVLLRFWLVVSFSIGAHYHCIPCFILGLLMILLVLTDTLKYACSVN